MISLGENSNVFPHDAKLTFQNPDSHETDPFEIAATFFHIYILPFKKNYFLKGAFLLFIMSKSSLYYPNPPFIQVLN